MPDQVKIKKNSIEAKGNSANMILAGMSSTRNLENEAKKRPNDDSPWMKAVRAELQHRKGSQEARKGSESDSNEK